MAAIGIAILTGSILDKLPNGTLLRPLLGIVVILLGVHRFVAGRIDASAAQRRRFGGERNRPWEGEDDEEK